MSHPQTTGGCRGLSQRHIRGYGDTRASSGILQKHKRDLARTTARELVLRGLLVTQEFKQNLHHDIAKLGIISTCLFFYAWLNLHSEEVLGVNITLERTEAHRAAAVTVARWQSEKV